MLYAEYLKRAGYLTMSGWKKLEIPELNLSFNTQKEDDLLGFIRDNYNIIEKFIFEKNLIFIDKMDLSKFTKDELTELGIAKTGEGFVDLDEQQKKDKMRVPRPRREAERSGE
jgi:hypothetical protein